MQKYPDKVVILKVVGDGPYTTPQRDQVYTGRCRAFLDRQAAFRLNRVMNSTYRVVIPDRSMPEIGENFVIAVRFHNNPSPLYWDVVGYVKDFARYERNCEIIFELVKENAIYEDLPAPTAEAMADRKLMAETNDWFRLESTGLVNGGLLEDEPVHIIRSNQGKDDGTGTFWNVTLELRCFKPTPGHPEGEWVDVTYGDEHIIHSGSMNYEDRVEDKIHFVFVPKYPVQFGPEEPQRTFRVCLISAQDNEVFFYREYTVFEKKA